MCVYGGGTCVKNNPHMQPHSWQDYIGGIIVFCATAASLLGSTMGLGPRLSPDMVGLAINYTLLVPVYLNWVVRFVADTEMGLCAVERVHHYASLPAEEEDDHYNEDEDEEEDDDDSKKHKKSPAFSDDIGKDTSRRKERKKENFCLITLYLKIYFRYFSIFFAICI